MSKNKNSKKSVRSTKQSNAKRIWEIEQRLTHVESSLVNATMCINKIAALLGEREDQNEIDGMCSGICGACTKMNICNASQYFKSF